MEDEKKAYKCFVIMPIKRGYDRVYEAIQSVAQSVRLFVYRADTSLCDLELRESILKNIQRADICIIDISDENPNVFLEYGVALAHGKVCIPICNQNTDPPASVRGKIVVFYDDKDVGLKQLRSGLSRVVEQAIIQRQRQIDSTTPPAHYFPNRAAASLPLLISEAQERVDILQTNLASVSADLMDSLLVALREHPSLLVRLVTLDPDSPFSIYRSRQLGLEFSAYRNELISSIQVLNSRLEEFGIRCQIRIYDDFPTQITYRIDDKLLYSIVTSLRRSRSNPLFVVSVSHTGVKESFLQHFETLWGSSRIYGPEERWELETTPAKMARETWLKTTRKPTGIEEGQIIKLKTIPYEFGCYVRSPRGFFGRSDELRRIIQKISEAAEGHYRHISVTGDYRIGKSSLLKRAEYEIASNTVSLPVYIDLSEVNQDYFVKSIITKIVDALYSKLDEQTFSKIKHFVSLKKFNMLGKFGLDVDVIGILKIRFDPKLGDHWDHFFRALENLILQAQRKKGYQSIALILDEINAITQWDDFREVLVKARSLAQSSRGLNLLVGSPYPLYELTKTEWSPFFNIFYQIKLAGLTDEEAEELIRSPASRNHVYYTEQAIELIKKLSGNKPYYIQVICTMIFEHMMKRKAVRNVITDSNVRTVIDDALEQLNSHFALLYDRCTEYQRALIQSVAHRKDSAAKALVSDDSRKVELALLRERGLVYPVGEELEIDGLFRQWLLRG